MDPRLRIATASTVMLVGLGLALLFRRPMSEKEILIPAHSEPLVLRKLPDSPVRTAAEVASARVVQPTAAPMPAPEPRRPTPVVLTPSDRPAAPPDLPQAFPGSTAPATSRWGVTLGQMLPETPKTPATHKVSDGDSLVLLAERYLGSAQRAMEIFELNRNVLADPQILPIGIELRIPRPDQAGTNAAQHRPIVAN